MHIRRMSGRASAVAALCVGALAFGTAAVACPPKPVAVATTPRIDMRVLVVDDGQPMVQTIMAQMTREGIPFDRVDSTNAQHAKISSGTLTVNDSVSHGRYQGIVASSDTPTGLAEDEVTALQNYQRAFSVRSIAAYEWPNPTVGLDAPLYSGAVDGITAQVTDAAKQDGFGYLQGTVQLDDFDSQVTESYGYIAPVASAPIEGTSFTPLLTAQAPGTATTGVLMGVFNDNGREQLVLTFAQNQYQQHASILGHGIVQWLTRGVHLGEYRNYFSVHVDDVFMADSLWSIEGNCTIGADCDEAQYPSTAPGATSRMTADDVAFLRSWQQKSGLKLDMVYNGYGSVEHLKSNRTDPVKDSLRANRNEYRWISHTYSHFYLGCGQDFTTDPWKCLTNARGQIQYASLLTIVSEISNNNMWGLVAGLPRNSAELVTGEHSGLKSSPQMAVDNPNLGPALTLTGVKWIASDASREAAQRTIGSARTVPRYPMNIFYNAETYQQQIAEYNWIYTSRANGGSGLCEDNPATSTCIEPLDPSTGYDTFIKPAESRIALRHVLSNDPRPHFVHQSNLAADRILYPVLDSVTGTYRTTFTAATPIINPAQQAAGQILQKQTGWTTAQNQISGTIEGAAVRITNNATGTVSVPLTTPAGAKVSSAAFGSAYAGSQSAWTDLTRGRTLTVTLAAAPYRAPSAVGASAVTQAPPPAPIVDAPTEVVEVPDAVESGLSPLSTD